MTLRLAAVAAMALAISACASRRHARRRRRPTADASGSGGHRRRERRGRHDGAAARGGGGSAGTAAPRGTTGSAGTTGGAGGGGSGGAGGSAGGGGTRRRGGSGGSAAGAGGAGRGGSGGSAGSGGRDRRRGPRRHDGRRGSGWSRGIGRAAGRGGAGGTAGTTAGSGGQGNLPAGVTSLFPPPDGTEPLPGSAAQDHVLAARPTLGIVRAHSACSTAAASAVADRRHGGGDRQPDDRRHGVHRVATGLRRRQHGQRHAAAEVARLRSDLLRERRQRRDPRAGGGAFSITDTNTWRFTTAAAAPSNRAALVRRARRLGQLLLGAGRVRSRSRPTTPPPSRSPSATGTYHEIVYLNAKSNVTLQGQDRNGTVISATNNNNLNPSTRGRALFGVDSVSNLVVRNLTIHNLTPQGGSQAEALRLQGCDKCVVRDATIISLQDTLLWSGRIYASQLPDRGQRRLRLGDGRRVLLELRDQDHRPHGLHRAGAQPGVELRLRVRRLAS